MKDDVAGKKARAIRYRDVLEEYFPEGYRCESREDYERFCEHLGKSPDDAPRKAPEEVWTILCERCVIHEGRAHAPDSLVPIHLRAQLMAAIDEGLRTRPLAPDGAFRAAKAVIYYEELYGMFREEFAGTLVRDAAMLRAYLSCVSGGRYAAGEDGVSWSL